MSQISKLIASILLFASIITATIYSSAANSNSFSSLSEQSSSINSSSESTINSIYSSSSLSQSLVITVLPNGKKQLKKKLSLEYTNSKFETDLNQNQKDAILTSLKKWKGELPVDNTFTVTSIASLKTDTTDNTSKVKKSKKETPTAQVIYMWARSVNPNWPVGSIPTGEESEEGDPRFIRTEFNVLLKATKNGKYKASIERDAEVKTEALEVTENPLDTQIYKDLFGTDKADNALTATQDILIDGSESISTANPALQFADTSLDKEAKKENTINSIKKVGFFESLFSFGAINVNAQANSYSWPWKNGDIWYPGQSWHQCETFNAANGYSQYIGSPSGCALDFQPLNSNYQPNLIAPASGVITRACVDNKQGMYKFDQMSILHIDSTTMNINDGVSVNKSDPLGVVYTPPQDNGNNTFVNYNWYTDSSGKRYYHTPCGDTAARHAHIKFPAILNGGNSIVIDGVNISGGTNYSPYQQSNGAWATNYQITSQNTPPPPPAPFNNQSGTIKLSDQYWTMDVVGANPANGTKIQLYKFDNNLAQKFQYNQQTKQIIGLNNKCIDVGNGAENTELTIQNCIAGQPQVPDGQRFTFNTNNTISNDIYGNCIDIPGGNKVSEVKLKIFQCHGGWNQQWPTSGVYRTAKYRFRRSTQVAGKSYCLDINLPANNNPIKNFECNNGNNQIWETYSDTSGRQVFRRLGTVQCLNSYNPVNNSILTSWYCDNSSDEAWTYTNNLLRRVGSGANNQCINSYLPANNVNMIMWQCNTADTDQIYNADYLGS